MTLWYHNNISFHDSIWFLNMKTYHKNIKFSIYPSHISCWSHGLPMGSSMDWPHPRIERVEDFMDPFHSALTWEAPSRTWHQGFRGAKKLVTFSNKNPKSVKIDENWAFSKNGWLWLSLTCLGKLKPPRTSPILVEIPVVFGGPRRAVEPSRCFRQG